MFCDFKRQDEFRYVLALELVPIKHHAYDGLFIASAVYIVTTALGLKAMLCSVYIVTVCLICWSPKTNETTSALTGA